MPTLLNKNHSSQKHLNATRRHCRLSKQINGCERFAAEITPAYNNLNAKKVITESKEVEREDSYDDLLLKEGTLDGKIKTVFERCSQYDRDNMGAGTVKKIFPEGKFTVITSLDRNLKPDAAKQIAVRCEALGEKHPLFNSGAELRTLSTVLQAGLDLHDTKISEVKMAEVEEDIAQAEVRKIYESNYFDARKLMGKDLAEKIFPQITAAKQPKLPKSPSPDSTNAESSPLVAS
jgi:hypothetical protein